MAYTIPEIITWSKMCQPLARIGEAKRKARGDNAADLDLDMKIYDTRIDVAYEYAQDPTSNNLFDMGNYLLSLCGVYLFTAQQVSATGGSISSISPSLIPPEPLEFIVSASSYISDGSPDAHLTGYEGWNIEFFRNSIKQSEIDTGGTYYSWDKTNAILTLLPSGTPAVIGDLFQINAILG
jgi:hypothetical protein